MAMRWHKYMGVWLKEEPYFQILNYANEHQFQQGAIFHLLEPDINQEIYVNTNNCK
jgi:hypothetical protein